MARSPAPRGTPLAAVAAVEVRDSRSAASVLEGAAGVADVEKNPDVGNADEEASDAKADEEEDEGEV